MSKAYFFPQRLEASPKTDAYPLPKDISREGQLMGGDAFSTRAPGRTSRGYPCTTPHKPKLGKPPAERAGKHIFVNAEGNVYEI